jgi:CRP-like cAMP-binding protein
VELSGSGAPLRLNLEAFTRLSPHDRALIDRVASKNVREAGPRRDLVREGDAPRAVNLILEGWACCYKQLPDGRRQVTSFLVPGEFGDANVFILREMGHSVGAITRVRYAEIAPADFEALMDESPTIARALWWHALVTAEVQREWTLNVGQRTAYERIAHLMCEIFLKLRTAGLTRHDGCDWPLTQADLADATGLTSVHVNRTLQVLRRDGLIALHARRLTIPDLGALMAAGLFSPNYLHFDGEGEAVAAQ